MKFRSTVYVYRTDNKESHPTTNPDPSIFTLSSITSRSMIVPLPSKPTESTFFTGLGILVTFLTPGCLQSLKEWDKEGNQKHLRASAPLIILDSKVLIRVYTTQTDHQGVIFQNLLYLTIWNDETNKMFAAQKKKKIVNFLIICSMQFPLVLILWFDNCYF